MLRGEEKPFPMTMTSGESILLGDKRKKLLNIYSGDIKIVTDVLQKDLVFSAFKLRGFEEIPAPLPKNFPDLKDQIRKRYEVSF
ncbi:hypothetical protein [Bdellovibrio bacteriovorus]|uniref:hypothetical protein n=1 Tax=Bdellovibrio bacteriovorus TaxID=959 RepID=UPI0035A6874E